MAKALYEERTFTNRATGEIIKFDFYGIVADVNGKYMELPLKALNPAEKIAFKVIAEGDDPAKTTVESRPATEEEKDFFKDFNSSSDDKLDLDE